MEENLLDDRAQTTCAGAPLHGLLRDRGHRVVVELELDPVELEEALVLLGQGVARFGQGWVGLKLLPEDLPDRLAVLAEMLASEGRSRAEVDIIVAPVSSSCDADMLARYGDLGVSEVIIPLRAENLDDLERAVDSLANSLIIPASRLTPGSAD